MTFLKWLGYAVTILGDVTGVWPAIQAVLNGVSPAAGATAATVGGDLAKIANVVVNVESAFAATTSTAAQSGAQKLAAATPGVLAVLNDWLQSGVLGSQKVQNPVLFQKASAEIAGGMADLLNSLEAPAPSVSTAQVQASQQQLASLAAAIVKAS